MQRSNLMPFFWAKLVAPALLFGVVTTGCAAGGGTVEARSNDEPTFAGAPSAPATIAPALANPGQATTPASGASNAAPGASIASTVPPTNVASTDTGASPAAGEDQTGSEGVPNGAAPIDDGGEDRDDPAGANPDADDDGDDDGDADDDDGANDEDDDDDDGANDDDGDDDDGDDDEGASDDDGDDNAGVTPAPNPPAPNPANPPAPAPIPAPDVLTFTSDVRAVLVSECGRCHASGGLPTFASANAANGYDVAFRERNSIVSEIRSGSMPRDTCNGSPGSNGCVSVADFNLIQQWVAAGAPE